MSHSIEELSVAQPGGYREVSPRDVVRSGYQGRVIDVREPAEFTGELGHMPKAELVPLATLATASAGWNRDQPLLLVCRSGARSGRAAQLLFGLGFHKLYNLTGGMIAHNEAGLPVSRS